MLICWKKGVRPDPWRDDPVEGATLPTIWGRDLWNGMSSSNTLATTCRKKPRWFNRGELSKKALPGTGMTIARHSFHSMSKRGNGQARRSSHDCLWKNKHENGKSPHHVLTKYILITSWNDPCSQFGLLFFFRCNLCPWKIVDFHCYMFFGEKHV